MTKQGFIWNKTTLYYVKCTFYKDKKAVRSFVRPTYAKTPILACQEALQQTIQSSSSETLFTTIIGSKET